MTAAVQQINSQHRQLVRAVTARPASDGDGVKLQRVFSFQANGSARSMDPFLLLDEFSSDEAADYIGGFPEHPHRGFETVTYMLEGRMEHRDHMGNTGQLVPGSVQWMTAASGIIHSEMPMQEEGRMQGFQLWINLPAADKMKAPAYQEYTPEQIPVYTLNNGTIIKAIAGQLQLDDHDVHGPVSEIATAPVYLDITLPADIEIDIPVPAEHTVLTYVFEGSTVAQDGNSLQSGQLGQWAHGDRLAVRGGIQGARLLLLAARPLGEPVAHYGPFVMNTMEEIDQAMRDYRNGNLVQQVEA